ncbi:MAG TPA: DUF4097 family beta strand repeat-containing protein [Rudaea sp.]|nr:DUF4097 family beta strand repeat-containing protein [Rudaea sp.]
MRNLILYIAASLAAGVIVSAGSMRADAADAGAPQNQTITAEGEDKPLDLAWSVAPGVRIEIGDVRGSVTVTGGDAAQVHVGGSLGEGSKLEIAGDAQHLSLKVEGGHNGWFGGNGPDSDTDLLVSVPRAAALKLGVVSADASVTGVAGPSLEVSGVSGKLSLASGAPQVDVNSVSGDIVFSAAQPNPAARTHLQTVSGDIQARKLGGRVKLETVSGDIKLDAGELDDLETGTVSGDATIRAALTAHGRMSMESMSGDIRVHLPDSLSAHVEASTFSGGIDSDFGKVREREHGSGSSLDARVGNGDAQIHAQTFSGEVELRRQGG